ncbi:hypothetical protein MYAM1_002237 [Malassezia yamatoensis]|uniref:FHA domain-containing protein n=1 Tax=Malassezia yamatoensis TaxID=253288 RepID=A0AAJ6CGM0_9BASI|nr:hypothetical protein MYAM1_002237 [Malassezia yamatoensis]
MAERAPPKGYGSGNAKYSQGGANPGQNVRNSNTEDSLMCPALHLYPLNDTFVPKQINLAPPSAQNRVKIGRYSNAKSVPNPLNGYFDSKVLSRAHAEVWSENDQVYIKDVKSSNGTFVNGTRLSPESQESEPYALHTDDVVDFGIDILTDDNKEILHHRVACRVFLVITLEDAMRLRNDFTSLYRGGVHGGALGNAGISPGAEGGLRRGKPGVNFDHVIFRLQNELQKSKIVGTELNSLSATIHNIHGTLGGGAPPVTSAPYPHLVPPSESAASATSDTNPQPQNIDAAAIASLEAQLSSTHSMLASHVDRIKGLESTLATYAHIADEVATLKQQLEDTKRSINTSSRNEKTNAWLAFGLPSHVRPVDNDDEDSASITSIETATPEPGNAIHPQHPTTGSSAQSHTLRTEPHGDSFEQSQSTDTDAESASRNTAETSISTQHVPQNALEMPTSTSEPSQNHHALLARIESLEKEVHEHDASRDAKPLDTLMERIAALEHSIETQSTAHEKNVNEQQRTWQHSIEKRWNQSENRLEEEQTEIQKLQETVQELSRQLTAIHAERTVDESNLSTQSKTSAEKSQEYQVSGTEPLSTTTAPHLDATNLWIAISISFAIGSSLLALWRT